MMIVLGLYTETASCSKIAHVLNECIRVPAKLGIFPMKNVDQMCTQMQPILIVDMGHAVSAVAIVSVAVEKNSMKKKKP